VGGGIEVMTDIIASRNHGISGVRMLGAGGALEKLFPARRREGEGEVLTL